MGKKVLLREGTAIAQSERGQYNFEYPSNKNYIVKKDTQCELLPWLGLNDKTAVIINDVSLSMHDYPRNVFWVKNHDILDNQQD